MNNKETNTFDPYRVSLEDSLQAMMKLVKARELIKDSQHLTESVYKGFIVPNSSVSEVFVEAKRCIDYLNMTILDDLTHLDQNMVTLFQKVIRIHGLAPATRDLPPTEEEINE